MLKEKWKWVPGFKRSYKISNKGRVKAVDRYDARGRFREEQILKPNTDRKGYFYVGLWKKSKSRTFRVHALVLTVFYVSSSRRQSVPPSRWQSKKQ
jgi:hypothetical protein